MTLTWQEFVWVDEFKGTGDVGVDAEHSPHLLHFLFVAHELKRNWHAKLEHLQQKLTIGSESQRVLTFS